MRKSIISVAVLAAVFGSSMAFAGVTTGAVRSVVGNTSITLEDGTVYTIMDDSAMSVMLGGYLPGDMVTIHWNMDGAAHDILAVSPDFSSVVSGQIVAIQPGASTVTLDNGTTYNFSKDDGQTFDLANYEVGDTVGIVAGPEGAGRSIAPIFVGGMTGAVQSINQGAGTLTLADGSVFHFDTDNAAALSGFAVGDMVRVESNMVGDQHWATAISPA